MVFHRGRYSLITHFDLSDEHDLAMTLENLVKAHITEIIANRSVAIPRCCHNSMVAVVVNIEF